MATRSTIRDRNMDGPDKNEPKPEVLAELSPLADGSRDPERAAALRRQIAGSPDLSDRYRREQQAVTARAALSAERAPARLRASVEGERRRRRRHPRAPLGSA